MSMETGQLYNIVLIGSPNVGKSSVFNYLIKKHEAVVRNEEGTTFDFRSKRINDIVLWDTPGSFDLIEIPFEPNKVVFIIENFVTENDKKRYLKLKTLYGEKLLVLINKIDLGEDEDYNFFEYYIKISVRGRINLALLDNVFNLDLEFENNKKIWAIIGRPNVGKSSLANLLYKAEINKVSPIAHTTKEYLPLEIEKNILLDTPGQVGNVVFPQYSNVFGIIIMIDTDFQKQDLRLINLAKERNKPFIVLFNKIDADFNKNVILYIERIFSIKIMLFSCQSNQQKNAKNLLCSLNKLEKMFYSRISTSQLNRWLEEEIRSYFPRLKFISNISVAPHVFFLDHQLTVTQEKMLAKRIQQKFFLQNLPIIFKYNSNT